MTTAGQLTFPEIDFEGRTVITTAEVALKWRCTDRHVRNVLGDPRERVEEGALAVLDIRSPGSALPCHRIPISAYRTFVAARLSGSSREHLLTLLPVGELRALAAEVQSALKRKGAAA